MNAGQKALKKVKAYPLSDDDIRKVLGVTIKIWNYPNLENLESVDDLFDEQGRAILLYPNNGPMSGHWCCLMNRKNGIEYFDSYGNCPEEPKSEVPQDKLEEWNCDRPFLTRLLKGSGKKVWYNHHTFQVSKGDVATCGRHCCSRLLYAPFSLEKYAGILKKSGLSPDDFVCGLTADKLKK
jgi:hypothetical protein